MEMYNNLLNLFLTYQDQRDGGDPAGIPFFNKKARQAAAQVLVHVSRGCIDDVEGHEYYHVVGVDVDGIELLHCSRGSSGLENLHLHMINVLGAKNISPLLLDCIQGEHRHRSNIRNARRHRAEVPDFGFYDVDIIEETESILRELQASATGLAAPSMLPAATAFIDTGETFGVGPLHRPTCEEDDYCFALGEPPQACKEAAAKMPATYRFLASCFQVGYPPTPVITLAEKRVYNRLVGEFTVGAVKPRLDADGMAAAWIGEVNFTTIFPKLPIQLTQYFTKFLLAAKAKATRRVYGAEEDEGIGDDGREGSADTPFPAPAPPAEAVWLAAASLERLQSALPGTLFREDVSRTHERARAAPRLRPTPPDSAPQAPLAPHRRQGSGARTSQRAPTSSAPAAAMQVPAPPNPPAPPPAAPPLAGLLPAFRPNTIAAMSAAMAQWYRPHAQAAAPVQRSWPPPQEPAPRDNSRGTDKVPRKKRKRNPCAASGCTNPENCKGSGGHAYCNKRPLQ